MNSDDWFTSAARPAVQDRKVARINATAEQRRQDRAAQVEIRAREAELVLERRRAELALKQEQKEAKRAARAQRRESWRQTRASLAARITAAAPTLGRRVMIAGPILAPMAVAWIGQIGFAVNVLHWPLIGGLLFAAGWELCTVFSGWMYHQARDDGDKGTIFRCATWFFAGSAGAMNYWHALDGRDVQDPTPKAVSFGAMSLAGIGQWELYTLLIHRRALRRAGKLPPARPSFGVVRWVQFPRVTWTARKLVILRGYTTVDQAWNAALAELARRARVKALGKAEKKAAKAGRTPVQVTVVHGSSGSVVRRLGPTQWNQPPIVWLPNPNCALSSTPVRKVPQVQVHPDPVRNLHRICTRSLDANRNLNRRLANLNPNRHGSEPETREPGPANTAGGKQPSKRTSVNRNQVGDRAANKANQVQQVRNLIDELGYDAVTLDVVRNQMNLSKTTAYNRLLAARNQWNQEQAAS